jgi:hypothetical protein
MRRLLLSIILLTTITLSAQQYHHFPIKDASKEHVRILFAGDAMQHSIQFKWAWNPTTRTYNYEPNFRYLQPYLEQAEVNIVNVETTFPGSKYSGYPQFRSPDDFFHAMLEAGFNVFALANNHINDSGQKGLMRTLKLIKPHPTMGAYLNASEREQQYPIILHVDGLKIALFDVSDPLNPAVLDSREYKDRSSDVQYDHKGLVVNKSEGWYAVPYASWDEEKGGVLQFRVSGEQLEETGDFTGEMEIVRCLYIGDYIYGLGYDEDRIISWKKTE